MSIAEPPVETLRTPPFRPMALLTGPVLATLGMFSIARGLAVWLADRRLLAFKANTRPGWVDALAQVHAPAFFNPGFWSFVVLAVATAIVLRRTVFGRYVYAIGSSEP